MNLDPILYAFYSTVSFPGRKGLTPLPVRLTAAIPDRGPGIQFFHLPEKTIRRLESTRRPSGITDNEILSLL